eukprot:13685-Heterococcus_DN1.PRE.1
MMLMVMLTSGMRVLPLTMSPVMSTVWQCSTTSAAVAAALRIVTATAAHSENMCSGSPPKGVLPLVVPVLPLANIGTLVHRISASACVTLGCSAESGVAASSLSRQSGTLKAASSAALIRPTLVYPIALVRVSETSPAVVVQQCHSVHTNTVSKIAWLGE